MCIKTRLQVALLIFLLPIYVTAEVVEYTDTGTIHCNSGATYHETQASTFDFTTMMFQSTAKGNAGSRGITLQGSESYEVECEGAFLVNGNTITFPTPTTCTGIIDTTTSGCPEFSFQTMETIITCNETGDICVSSLVGESQALTFPPCQSFGRVCSSSRTLVRTGQSTGGGGPTESYEFEDLTFTNSTGQNFVQSKSKSSASNGAYFQYDSDAVGQFVTFPISVSTAGTYNLNLQYHLTRYRGTFLVEVSDDPNTGYVEIDRQDMTVTSGASFETLLMMYPFMTTGTKYLRFRVTGSNPVTGSERMGLDKIDVMLQ